MSSFSLSSSDSEERRKIDKSKEIILGLNDYVVRRKMIEHMNTFMKNTFEDPNEDGTKQFNEEVKFSDEMQQSFSQYEKKDGSSSSFMSSVMKSLEINSKEDLTRKISYVNVSTLSSFFLVNVSY